MNGPADLDYAIKKDVRNNPIIREADTRQHREFTRTAAIWALIVVMFLFAAWQHASVLQHEYQIERLLQHGLLLHVQLELLVQMAALGAGLGDLAL